MPPSTDGRKRSDSTRLDRGIIRGANRPFFECALSGDRQSIAFPRNTLRSKYRRHSGHFPLLHFLPRNSSKAYFLRSRGRLRANGTIRSRSYEACFSTKHPESNGRETGEHLSLSRVHGGINNFIIELLSCSMRCTSSAGGMALDSLDSPDPGYPPSPSSPARPRYLTLACYLD